MQDRFKCCQTACQLHSELRGSGCGVMSAVHVRFCYGSKPIKIRSAEQVMQDIESEEEMKAGDQQSMSSMLDGSAGKVHHH